MTILAFSISSFLFSLNPFPLQGSEVGFKRYYALGHTDIDRLLFVVFTVRGDKIRVISARDMSRKERKVYQSYEEDTKV